MHSLSFEALKSTNVSHDSENRFTVMHGLANHLGWGRVGVTLMIYWEIKHAMCHPKGTFLSKRLLFLFLAK